MCAGGEGDKFVIANADSFTWEGGRGMFEQESEGGRGWTCSLASMSSRGPPGRGKGEGSRSRQEREAALGREVRGEGS